MSNHHATRHSIPDSPHLLSIFGLAHEPCVVLFFAAKISTTSTTNRWTMSAGDILFYVSDGDKVGTVDVPLADGEIVSINLADELADDPNELISFLQQEKGARKFWVAIALAYCSNGKYDEAREVAERALAMEHFSAGDRDAVAHFLVWLELERAQHARTGAQKQAAVALAAQAYLRLTLVLLVAAQLLQATLHVAQGDDDQALTIFERVLKEDANNCFALTGKANLVVSKLKNYALALKLYQQVLVVNPLFKPDPRLGIGMCYWFLKDQKMAVAAWKRSAALYGGRRAEVLLALAEFDKTLTGAVSDDEFVEKYTGCIEQFNKLQSPVDLTPALVLASYYFSKGEYDVVERVAVAVAGKILGDDATSDPLNIRFKTAQRPRGQDLEILSQCALWLARVQFCHGNFVGAQKYFGELIKLSDANLQAKLGLGLAQLNRGSVEDAIMTFEQILKKSPRCLEVNYALGVLYAQLKLKRKRENAIQVLERYVRLAGTTKDNEAPQPVTTNAFLVLASLYELRDLGQLLNYLQKAIDARTQVGSDAPLEVYNNMGVFHFIRKNFDAATKLFEQARERCDALFVGEDGDTLVDLPGDLKVTIGFNLARSTEVKDTLAGEKMYHELVEACPNYFSAKLRLLFLRCLAGASTKDNTEIAGVKLELDELVLLHASELEIRSFYGWFVKNFGKRLGLAPDTDTNHQKDTLVDHDSHDCYALISLANIYCIMARDLKHGLDDLKKRKYYVRAVELYTKVLLIDPKDVYAAQGLAIAYIETGDLMKGLDILRKIRDSLNDILVYLNLGHALVDSKAYAKAIENYEIALGRFTDGKDQRILLFLGRAWYLRGVAEKHLPFLQRAKQYTVDALAVLPDSALIKFNLAYVEFQIAEFITKQPVNQRKLDEIDAAAADLRLAVDLLNELALTDESVAVPYPRPDLQARANLGTTALLPRLQTCRDETQAQLELMLARIEEGKKLREREAEERRAKEEQAEKEKRDREEELARERAKLQEQTQKWAEEFRAANVPDDDSDDEKKTKKKKKKDESDDEGDASDDNTLADDNEPALKKKKAPKKKATKRKKRVVSDDEDDEANGDTKKPKLSEDHIVDSDKELDDEDGLF